MSQDGPVTPAIFVSWYDWAGVSCTIDGVQWSGTDWAHSACYEVRLGVSHNLGAGWIMLTHGFPTISDPALLPWRVPGGDNKQRFLGDYHSVTGDLLHSVHVAITAPVGGTDEVANVERGWLSHGYWDNSH